jgi:hypothetical protein
LRVGETVVLVNEVQGVPAGKQGKVIRVHDESVVVGYQSRERLELLLARTWELLPERMWRRCVLLEKKVTLTTTKGGIQANQ